MTSREVTAKWSKGVAVAAVVVAALLLSVSAGWAAPGSSLFVQADTVLGSANLTGPELPVKSCVADSRFAHNEQIVFRAKVLDPDTGEAMDDQALQSVQVLLGDGTVLEARYSGHPGGNATPTDYFWAIAWIVPPTYPTGTLDYTIVATANDGRVGTYVPFNVGSSLVAITDQVRPVIAKP